MVDKVTELASLAIVPSSASSFSMRLRMRASFL